ncbi:MAG: hypothetical protein GXO91_04840 [FCB group bacterium]|nr:hypothetical protein [FCB group bacterium]
MQIKTYCGRLTCLAVLLLLFTSPNFAGDLLRPYILIGESGESVEKTTDELIRAMFMNNFELLGRYAPAGDSQRYVMVVSNELLKAAINIGPSKAALLGGIRIGITAKGKMTYISCQDPEYWANAYFQEDYPKVHLFIEKFKEDLLKAMPKFRMRSGIGFGSQTGLSVQDLREYHFDRKGAPQLNAEILLHDYPDYTTAITTIGAKLEASSAVRQVFKFELPDKEVALFGVALTATPGEQKLVKLLDQAPRKNTAFLPLEILIVGHKVYLLDPLYRLPLSFPDMDKRSYKKLRKLVPELTDQLDSLLH